MSVGSIDGSHGWARSLWESLNEHGIWGVPRCGLLFEKQEGKLILIDRMPWEEGMPVSAEVLRAAQDEDLKGIRTHFGKIGVEVVEREGPA